jgi:hypothetical protein
MYILVSFWCTIRWSFILVIFMFQDSYFVVYIVNTEKDNKELNSICRQENIDFVNHSENFLLKNGKIVNGLLYSD